MARQTQDPLKHLRQKQAADAKLLAAQNIHRAGALKEQEKIIVVEEVENKSTGTALKH
jgi:hypothetical protein